jgi:short-subunit dehydrogenase
MKVLITGASGGLGRAFVNECAKRNYTIIATDINQYGLDSIKKGIEYRFAKEIFTYQCDITSQESVDSLIKYLENNNFNIDMLLNVAGLDYEGGFIENGFQEINNIIQLNISGTLRITHEIISKRIKERPLYIVNVSSLAAEQPMPLKATYAASKRFLLDFSYALAEEMKSESVNVLALCPGGLATKETVIKAIEGQGFFGQVTTCNIERMVHQTINNVLKGKRKYVPNIFNKITAFLGGFIPITITTRILYKRWSKAQSTWLNK